MKLLTVKFEEKTYSAVSNDGRSAKLYDMDILELAEKLESIESLQSVCEKELVDLKILSPIVCPAQDVLCLGLNYYDHQQEVSSLGSAYRSERGNAVYFSKRANFIIGPDEYIDGHFDFTEKLDYEVELAVIIKKDAYKVKKEDALDYVLGYSVFNDITARDVQLAHTQYHFGKSLDTFCAMGPWIVTADELPFEPELEMSCYVNGERRQHSNTKLMIFGIADVIEELSRGMMLKAGSIISMGTPGGVAMGMNPPKFLKSGDEVVCEIEKIGVLRNIVK